METVGGGGGAGGGERVRNKGQEEGEKKRREAEITKSIQKTTSEKKKEEDRERDDDWENNNEGMGLQGPSTPSSRTCQSNCPAASLEPRRHQYFHKHKVKSLSSCDCVKKSVSLIYVQK